MNKPRKSKIENQSSMECSASRDFKTFSSDQATIILSIEYFIGIRTKHTSFILNQAGIVFLLPSWCRNVRTRIFQTDSTTDQAFKEIIGSN
jgi:hypothetical protein